MASSVSPFTSIGAPILAFLQAQREKKAQDAAMLVAAAQRKQAQANLDRDFTLKQQEANDANTRAGNTLDYNKQHDADTLSNAHRTHTDEIYQDIQKRVSGLGAYKPEDQPVAGQQILADYYGMGLDKEKGPDGAPLYAPPMIPGMKMGQDAVNLNGGPGVPVTAPTTATDNGTAPEGLADSFMGGVAGMDTTPAPPLLPAQTVVPAPVVPTLPMTIADQNAQAQKEALAKQAQAKTIAEAAKSRDTGPILAQAGKLPHAVQRAFIAERNKTLGLNLPMPGMPSGNPSVNNGYVPYYEPDAVTQSGIDAKGEAGRHAKAMEEITKTHYKSQAEHDAAVLKETGRHNLATEARAKYNSEKTPGAGKAAADLYALKQTDIDRIAKEKGENLINLRGAIEKLAGTDAKDQAGRQALNNIIAHYKNRNDQIDRELKAGRRDGALPITPVAPMPVPAPQGFAKNPKGVPVVPSIYDIRPLPNAAATPHHSTAQPRTDRGQFNGKPVTAPDRSNADIVAEIARRRSRKKK